MPALQSAISRTVTSLITSPALRAAARKRHALLRKLRGARAQVHYFHQPDDPYSHLAAMQLDALSKRYRIELITHIVPAPDAAAAPDQERLRAWSARDAQRLAAHYGLAVPDFSQPFESLHTASASALEQGRVLRAKWGHYLGAMFYFEGEWYWGIDRLHFLEQRLAEAGLGAPVSPLVPAPQLQLASIQSTNASASPPVIHFYCSLRSPYTYLAATQVQRLAAHYGATLQIRFVLPMVMRGLPVPLAKRLYIIRDTKREAERLGMPFGSIVDPVGTPTERGLALLHKAIQTGRGIEMAQSFLRGVFAEGVDAGSDKGLQALAERAGFSQDDMRAALANESWRAVAEENRADMLARGLWGVPSFRVNDLPAVWGQDRLWMVEQDILQVLRRN
jgi:2-hydroxychromene-2-carboxylate isomerase